MTMSVKMLAEIAAHAQAMADEAQAMATAMQAVVNDCAEQVAAKQGVDAVNADNGENSMRDTRSATSAKTTGTKDATNTSAPGGASTEPPWVAEADATLQPPKPEPGKKLTIAEVRAYVASRTKPENRAQIRAILKGFGVAKLTELPEDKYSAMMEEVAKL